MQNYVYPSSSDVTIQGSPNGQPIPNTSVVIGGENPSGNTTPVQTDANGNLIVSPLTSSSIVTANQGTANTLANAWPVKLTDGTNVNSFTANGLKVDVQASVLPTGAATAANQASEISELTSIAANTLTISDAVGAPLTAAPTLVMAVGWYDGTQTHRASCDSSGVLNVNAAIAALPLPTGAATAALQSNVQSAPGTSASVALTVQGSASGVALPISAAALPLPTGAATSALQTTGNTSLASILANQTNKTQASQVTDGTNVAAVKAASTAPVAADPALVVTLSPNSSGATAIKGTVIGNAPIQNVYSSTNITTGAFVQLVASTTNVINTIHIFDSSGQAMIFAIGGSGSEVAQLYVPPGGDTYTLNIPAGSRISYKALSANATSGYLLMSFLE